ncbi:IMCE [Symbiodinium sp. KB8]|nr:IMCE [Symbiodinium sp. KB8]
MWQTSSFLVGLLLGPAVAKRCTKHFKSLKAGDACSATWRELTASGLNGDERLAGPLLLPTQPSIGYAWVHAQHKKYFMSKKDASKELEKAQFPVVLGGSHFYLTDHHHHAAALQLSDDEDIFDIDMNILVVCDLRSLGEATFWAEMIKRKYVYLESRESPYALPHTVGPDVLPSGWALQDFEDNLWRSLAGFASHVDDASSRCYIKSCDEFFVDFQWGYAINVATEYNTTLWPSRDQHAAFQRLLHSLPYPSLKDADLQDWKKLGEQLLPLCHVPALHAYPLPAGFPSTTLQGWSAVPVPDDPSCKYESCTNARMNGQEDAHEIVV